MKRSKRTLKSRSQLLMVERLECRRLLSASPNRFDVPNSVLPNSDFRSDALSQSQNGNQSHTANQIGDRGQEQDGQDRQGRDNRDRHAGSRDASLRASISVISDFNSNARNDSQDRDAARDRGRSRGDARHDSVLSLVPSSSSVTLAQSDVTMRPEFLTSSLPVLGELNAPSKPLSASFVRAFPPAIESLPEVLESTLPSSEPPVLTAEVGLRPPLEPFGPRFVASNAEALPIVASVASNAAVSTANQPAPVFASARSTVNDAFAVAAQSVVSFELDDDDDQSSPRQLDSNSEVFGGHVDLEQLPHLVDTLPAIINETMVPFDEASTEDEEGDSEDDSSVRSLEQTQKRQVGESPKASESKSSQTLVEMEDASTDIVFADAEEVDLFGGEVEMPVALVHDSSEEEISFDSIVPVAPRIDQIMTQAPLVEIGEQSDDVEEETEPISINIQASLPAAILLLPVLGIRSAQRKRKELDALEGKKTATLRYLS